jgi:hypothetical protein
MTTTPQRLERSRNVSNWIITTYPNTTTNHYQQQQQQQQQDDEEDDDERYQYEGSSNSSDSRRSSITATSSLGPITPNDISTPHNNNHKRLGINFNPSSLTTSTSIDQTNTNTTKNASSSPSSFPTTTTDRQRIRLDLLNLGSQFAGLDGRGIDGPIISTTTRRKKSIIGFSPSTLQEGKLRGWFADERDSKEGDQIRLARSPERGFNF